MFLDRTCYILAFYQISVDQGKMKKAEWNVEIFVVNYRSRKITIPWSSKRRTLTRASTPSSLTRSWRSAPRSTSLSTRAPERSAQSRRSTMRSRRGSGSTFASRIAAHRGFLRTRWPASPSTSSTRTTRRPRLSGKFITSSSSCRPSKMCLSLKSMHLILMSELRLSWGKNRINWIGIRNFYSARQSGNILYCPRHSYKL